MTPGCVLCRWKSSVTAPIDHVECGYRLTPLPLLCRLRGGSRGGPDGCRRRRRRRCQALSQPSRRDHETATFGTSTERTQETVGVTTMKAIVQDKYGSAHLLQLRDTATSAPRSLSPLSRSLSLAPPRSPRLPLPTGRSWAAFRTFARPAPTDGLRTPKNGIRGTDVDEAGEAVGSAGTIPAGPITSSARAAAPLPEYAAASEEGLAIKPANLTFEQAATFPMAGIGCPAGTPRPW